MAFQTAREAYDTRWGKWERRQEAERRERQALEGSGEGVTKPLSAVPELDRYLYDLQGYLVLKGAVGPEQLAQFNAAVDANDPMPGVALGITQEEALAMMEQPHHPTLKDLQQGFADGIPALGTHPCFDSMIDHPSWISHIREFTNGADTRMTGGGGVSCRWPGQASGVHGGGHNKNTTFEWVEGEWPDGPDKGRGSTGRFHCQTVSILLALNDCPPGGGSTFVVVSRSPTPPLPLGATCCSHVACRRCAARQP